MQAMETLETTRNTGTMHTLDRSGDVRHMWDKDNEAEVAAARTLFGELTQPRSRGGKGYLAYRAEGKDGHQGRQIREFDPDLERIILVQPPVGG